MTATLSYGARVRAGTNGDVHAAWRDADLPLPGFRSLMDDRCGMAPGGSRRAERRLLSGRVSDAEDLMDDGGLGVRVVLHVPPGPLREVRLVRA